MLVYRPKFECRAAQHAVGAQSARGVHTVLSTRCVECQLEVEKPSRSQVWRLASTLLEQQVCKLLQPAEAGPWADKHTPPATHLWDAFEHVVVHSTVPAGAWLAQVVNGGRTQFRRVHCLAVEQGAVRVQEDALGCYGMVAWRCRAVVKDSKLGGSSARELAGWHTTSLLEGTSA